MSELQPHTAGNFKRHSVTFALFFVCAVMACASWGCATPGEGRASGQGAHQAVAQAQADPQDGAPGQSSQPGQISEQTIDQLRDQIRNLAVELHATQEKNSSLKVPAHYRPPAAGAMPTTLERNGLIYDSSFVDPIPTELIPDIFGVKLGAYVKDYPTMRLRKSFDDNSSTHDRLEDRGRSFEGVPTIETVYCVYNSRIFRIFFTFKPEYLDAFLNLLTLKYGPYKLYEDQTCMWESNYFGIWIEPDERKNSNYAAYFEYIPLDLNSKSDLLGIKQLSYNGIRVGDPISLYKMMTPYKFLDKNYQDIPEHEPYISLKDDKEFGVKSATPIYWCYKGIIFTIDIYFSEEDLPAILKYLHTKYAALEEKVFKQENTESFWQLGQYIVYVGPSPGGNYYARFMYWPAAEQSNIYLSTLH